MGLSQIVIGVALATLLGPHAAHADESQCKEVVLRRGTDVFVSSNDLQALCERGQLRATTSEGCPSTRDVTRMGTFNGRATAAITDACAGESSETRTCLFEATGEWFDLVSVAGFGGSPRPQPDGPRRVCRKALGRDTTRAGNVTARQLAVCNLAVLHGDAAYGPPGATCDGPGGTQAKIAEAATRLATNVGRACGGSDHTAGTADDLDPQTDLGFGGTCPGSPYCEFTIDTLPDLITCAQCVAREEAKQVARGLTALPLDGPTTCQVAVGDAATVLAIAYLRDVSVCEDRVLDGRTTPPCPDAETSADLASSATAYDARIAAACGGPSGPPSSDVTAVADVLIQSLYPTHAEETDNDLGRCKKEIGAVASTGTTGYARKKLNALDTCRVQSLCGQTAGVCPDSEAAHAIASAITTMRSRIHSRCDDFTPAALGFAPTCPVVADCGGLPTTTIDELITCIQCVGDAVVDAVITGL